MSAALKAIAWKRAIVLFPVCLTVALFLFGARLDLPALSPTLLAVNGVLAVVLAGGATAILIMAGWGLSRLWRKSLSRVTLFTLRRATETGSRKVAATGIGSRDGELIVSLSAGI